MAMSSWERRARAWKRAAEAWKAYAGRNAPPGERHVADWLQANHAHSEAEALDPNRRRSELGTSSSKGARKLAEARIVATSQEPTRVTRLCGAHSQAIRGYFCELERGHSGPCRFELEVEASAPEAALEGAPASEPGEAAASLGKIASTCSRANETPRHLRGLCCFWRSSGFEWPDTGAPCRHLRDAGESLSLCAGCIRLSVPGARCRACHGSGLLSGPDILAGGRSAVELDCPRCGGRGWTP